MPGCIKEKLASIERHAKNLYEQTPGHVGKLEQVCLSILGDVRAIEKEAERLGNHNAILYNIKELVEKGGDSPFVLKGIKQLLTKL